MIVHRIIGIFLGGVFLLIFSSGVDWFPAFNYAQKTISIFDEWGWDGILYIYMLSFFGIYVLIFPEQAKHKWSPRVGMMQSYLLKEGFWVMVGYFSVLTTFIVLSAFE